MLAYWYGMVLLCVVGAGVCAWMQSPMAALNVTMAQRIETSRAALDESLAPLDPWSALAMPLAPRS